MTASIAMAREARDDSVLRVVLSVASALLPATILIVLHWGLLPPLASTDYAQYLLHAKALVEGRPYGDTGYLFTPYAPFIGPRVLPPGLPLTLAPFVALVGTDSPLLRLVVIGSAMIFVLLAWSYFARVESRPLAWSVAVVLGVSLESFYSSVQILSDVGFAALVWALIVTIDLARGRWSWSRVAGVTLLGFAAMSYRVAAVAIVPAVILWALLNARQFGWRPLAAPLVWMIAIAAAVLSGLASRVSPAQMLDIDLQEIMVRIIRNGTEYRLSTFASQLYPFAGNGWNDAYHAVAAVLAVIGVVAFARTGWRRFVVVFSAVYVVMLIFAPVVDSRYMWPLYPVSIGATFLGLRTIVGFVWKGRRVMPDVLTIGAAATIAVMASVRIARAPDPPSLLERQDVRDLFTWVRETSRDGETRYVFVNPRVLSLETGVKAMGLFAAPSHEAALEELSRLGITHVVLDSLGLSEDGSEFLTTLIEANPSRFSALYSNSTFRVYQVRRDDSAGARAQRRTAPAIATRAP